MWRMRLALLSEIPQRWAAKVRAWSAKNEAHRTQFQPDRNLEYLYYQTLVGSWPIETERCKRICSRPRARRSSTRPGLPPNEAYEQALAAFVNGTMSDAEFRHSVAEFAADLAAGESEFAWPKRC